ncbi:AP-4 complex accessory subunit Tepsin-like [Mytilus edulis]|uniref:AP-4 complex accessory subunit Tepsin-like n=1 Tax=Mytilus edulis TaxID=6550 RepID=UPI0039F0A305
MDKVSFVNKISVLMKATSDDANPIQGYLYQEVNKITFESDGYRESTLEFLVDRLNKQSCHVKFKVLKLLKFIVENGPSEFRLGLMKNSHGIREATKYSSPEDPLHGNVPNKAVRQIAQELSQLLFDTELKQSPGMQQERSAQDKSRITGLGNANVSPKGSMQGFGNSPTKTKSSFMDKLTKFATGFQDRTKEQQAAILSSIESYGDYKPPPLPVVYNEMAAPQQEEKEIKHQVEKQVKPIQHIPGKVGGGWDDEDEETGNQTTSVSSQDGDTVFDGTDHADSWCEEENLVEQTLASSDDTLLTVGEIKQFISSCQNLNCEKVIELLNTQLKSTTQCVVLKSLLLIEYLVNTGLVNCDFICKTCQNQLLQLSTEESSVSSTKANKILLCFEKLLNIRLLPKDDMHLMLMED